MLKRVLFASAAMLLLLACQQPQPQTQSQAVTAASTRSYSVFFDTGSAALSAESSATIAQAANAFKAGGRAVAVAGHTDTTGSADFNLRLSQQRAAAVSDALLRNGVPTDAIAALGYGEENLPVPTAQNVAERRNRSVDITISDRSAASLMSDTDYCKALSRTYRRYRSNQIEEDMAYAMSRCETTDAASAASALERRLTEMKGALPARTMPRA